MKMSAGYALNHRNPTQAPAIVAPSSAVDRSFWRNAMDAYDSATIITVPAASPSRPSVRFTPFDVPTIMKKTRTR